eukprot:1344909-Amorphochlora_amoeboformis.AAC.1
MEDGKTKREKRKEYQKKEKGGGEKIRIEIGRRVIRLVESELGLGLVGLYGMTCSKNYRLGRC